MLSAEELLAGAELNHEIRVPGDILNPMGDGPVSGTVRLRPLSVGDLQRITRAAKENDQLMATFMVQQALIEPELTVAQTAALHVGLLHFLLDQVNRISGITASPETLSHYADAPFARAAHILAREFGWTPQEVNGLTLGQVLLHLQMLKEGRSS